MTGQLFGFSNADRSGPPLFSLTLAGGGTATYGPVKNLGNAYLLNSGGVNFHFEDPAAVPEPASMMLLGSGLAVLAAARRRNQRR